MANRRPIRLLRQRPEHVKSGILHAISLASVVLSYARGRATGRRRLCTQLEQATAEIAPTASTITRKPLQISAAQLGTTPP